MKTIHKVLSCSCVLLLSLPVPAFSDFAHVPGKSSVIVLQGEVTIDGQPRQDLGRSFSDTITGGLLKTGAYSVIDHLSSQPLAEAIEKNPNIAPEQSAVAFGKDNGARWIMVPRMVVEGDFHKLTLKKIRVSDGQVVDVFEAHGSGDRSTMFLLIGDALRKIYADNSREMRLGKTSTGEPPLMPEARDLDPNPIGGNYIDPAPEPSPIPAPEPEAAPEPEPLATQSADPDPQGTEVASTDNRHVPDGLKLEGGTHVRDDEADPGVAGAAHAHANLAAESESEPVILDPATETEEEIAELMGTISTINPEWRFCILKLRADHDLAIGDSLSVKTATIVPTKRTLQIKKIEGRQAVADLIEGVEFEPLKVGQTFYRWVPR